MSRYEIDEVITRWARNQITAEQAIGQILLHVQALATRVGELEKRVQRGRHTKRRQSD